MESATAGYQPKGCVSQVGSSCLLPPHLYPVSSLPWKRQLTSLVVTAGQIFIPDTQEGYGAEGLLHGRTRLSNRNLYPFPSIVYTIFFSVPSGLVANSHYVYEISATEVFAKVPWNKRKALGRLLYLALVCQTPDPFSSDKNTTHYDSVSDQVMPLSVYRTPQITLPLVRYLTGGGGWYEARVI